MERKSILTNPLPEGFTKVPPKPEEIKVVRKTTHRSEGKSSGQFGQAPCQIILTSLLDIRKFKYDRLYTNPGVVIAWAEMSIVLDELTREVNSELSWLQHWHNASDIPHSVYYGRAHQSDSRLVVIIAYLINHVLDNKVELEKIWANTGWCLCRPHQNQEQMVAEMNHERQDALAEETWRNQ